MTIYDIPLRTLGGEETSLVEHKGKALLIVNVASKCGLTPQYEGLQALHAEYQDKGLEVLGFPCNQFMGQEPGTADEIQSFCDTNYGVTFPLYEKIEVNGVNRHPLYGELVDTPDDKGHTGDIRWNFEKFLVAPNGEVAARFNPTVKPDDPALVSAIEDILPE